MNFGRTIPLVAAAAVLFTAAPAWSQSQGTAEDALGSEGNPVIIEDRPVPDEPDEDGIRREGEAFVQVRGAWAGDEAACANMQEDAGGGLYVTDTLIRWEDAACSIREIDSENGAADVYAQCATETGRRDRRFRLEMNGEDRLTLRVFAGTSEEEIALRRCEAGQ